MTKQELLNDLKKIGYTIDEEESFNYYNNGNEKHYKARFCYIIAIDSGLNSANIDARTDENYKKLQAYRLKGNPVIKGIQYEI